MSEQNQAIPNPMLDAAKRQAEELLDMVAAEQRTHEATRAERDRLRAELAAERERAERAASELLSVQGTHLAVLLEDKTRREHLLWRLGVTEEAIEDQPGLWTWDMVDTLVVSNVEQLERGEEELRSGHAVLTGAGIPETGWVGSEDQTMPFGINTRIALLANQADAAEQRAVQAEREADELRNRYQMILGENRNLGELRDRAVERAAQAEAARQRAALDEIANSMCNDIAHPHCILAERALTESAGRELLEAGDEVTQRSGQLEELLKHGLVGMRKSVGLETGVMTVSMNDWQEWDRKSIVALDAYAAALARWSAVRGQ